MAADEGTRGRRTGSVSIGSGLVKGENSKPESSVVMGGGDIIGMTGAPGIDDISYSGSGVSSLLLLSEL